MARREFAWWALQARFRSESQRCPYCGSIFYQRLQRKWLLIQARKCVYCDLIYRWPTESPDKADAYYEETYDGGIVTDLPSPKEIDLLKETSFAGSRFEGRDRVDLVQEIQSPPARVLDFGSSWGYLAAQIAAAGYDVEGFELSRRRAEFGRAQLGLTIHTSWDVLLATQPYDIVFTSHTLEHLNDLWSTLRLFARVTRPEGTLAVIVPNGGGREARTRGVRWGPFIGETHTVALTPQWFYRSLPTHGFEAVEVFSTPNDADTASTCDGDELVCLARRVSEPH